MAESDALIVGSGAEPNRSATIVELADLPETNVIPLAGVVADRLLEGEIFFAAKEKQVADRRLDVGARKDRVFGYFDVAPDAQRGGRIPLRGLHDPFDLLL